MKTRSSILMMAIAAISIGVAVPVPDASAVPPGKRLGTNRNHVSEKHDDRITLMEVIARSRAGTKACCAKSVSTCGPVAEQVPAASAKVKSAKSRTVRPYWHRKRHG